MAVFLHVAAGRVLAATGEAAEMMRASPAYREITADGAQGRIPAVATGQAASAPPGEGETTPAGKSASKRKRTAKT